MKVSSQRGEGPAVMILGGIILAIAILLVNYTLGCVQETKEERAGGGSGKHNSAATPTPVTKEPGGYDKTYKPGFGHQIEAE